MSPRGYGDLHGHLALLEREGLLIRVEELTVAGRLACAPLHVVRCKTVDLVVPAESEIVVEPLLLNHLRNNLVVVQMRDPAEREIWPWHGYSLGEWCEEFEEEARLAVEGSAFEVGERLAKRRIKGEMPNKGAWPDTAGYGEDA